MANGYKRHITTCPRFHASTASTHWSRYWRRSPFNGASWQGKMHVQQVYKAPVGHLHFKLSHFCSSVPKPLDSQKSTCKQWVILMCVHMDVQAVCCALLSRNRLATFVAYTSKSFTCLKSALTDPLLPWFAITRICTSISTISLQWEPVYSCTVDTSNCICWRSNCVVSNMTWA